MSSDALAALIVIVIGIFIISVPPVRHFFYEHFLVGDRERREREILTFEPEAYANPSSESSARLADDKALKKAGLFTGKGWRFGYSKSERVLRYAGPGHMMLVAPPRSGKAVSVLVPMLLDKRRGSVVVIDPKGELCAITGHSAKSFSDVVIIAPFGSIPDAPKAFKGLRSVGFNPLDAIDPNSLSFGGDIDDLADGIVLHQSGGDSSFFDDTARNLVGTVIRIVVRYYPPAEKNLVTVRKIIAGDVFAFARQWANCNDEIARDGLNDYAQDGAEKRKSLGDCISTARTQTKFIETEGISHSLRKSEFVFADVKKRPMTVYIILPLDKLASCGKWFRLCMAAMLSALLKAGPRGLPVLCICDEFFSIGPLQTFQTAMSQAAGAAKLQLLPVLQDLAQLETMYPNQGWRTFLSCAAVKIFFGSHGDKQTSEYVSEMAGEREVVVHSRSLHRDPRSNELQGSSSASTTWQRLIQPHEIRRMDLKTEMIAFVEGVPGPVMGKRRAYYDTREFSGKYRTNPYFKKKSLFG
jgi:type IV secretion system protein VirD4